MLERVHIFSLGVKSNKVRECRKECSIMSHKYPPAPEGYEYIFVTHYKHAKTGKTLYAKHYGKKVFCLLVPIDRASKD
tara:strand:+ start:1794 stop:2027 length:234 start_codon:yes stop_codon:yes gene_type:complete